MKRRKQTPLEYMLAIMNDPDISDDRRDRMASMAAPYCHPKLTRATIGKKDDQTQAALTAGILSGWSRDLEYENRPS